MIYAISLLVSLLLWQAGEPTQDLDRLRREAAEAAEKHRQEAVRLNELAGHIKTESDAENLIDSIAEMFEDDLPPPWATRDARHRLAKAEYGAVTNTGQLIPEDRIADIWNQYARAIGAGDETIVTAAEIHGLRDLQYASADFMWSESWGQNIWTMPNVFAVAPDGKVAGRCRPLEAMRVFYDLDHQFRNLRVVRKALAEGKSFSDEMKRAKERKRALDRSEARAELRVEVDENPVRVAEYRFMNEHGSAAMHSLLKSLLDQFPPQ